MLERGGLLAGKYRLDKPSGFGGMAQLWAAKNEATGADVCVKVLVPVEYDDEAVARFRREAHAAARLSHRAIVRIFDLVELDGEGDTTTSGTPAALAIVMELLRGETLGDVLMKRGKLPLEETVDLAIPILSALAHAHRAGVVHRDLKPDNVFLASDPDGHVIPKVLDFGVSKMAPKATSLSSQRPGPPPLTLDGTVLGTPSFMSPEQARGSRHVDARSDVFSAGILVYTMLVGSNPFEGEQLHSVVSSILQHDPPRPSGVPDEVWDVVARCLAKDPDARYADATELGIALRRASGRTSPTHSGPEAAGLSPPRMTTAPLGGDSIVTVPPVSGLVGEGEAEAAPAPPGLRGLAIAAAVIVVAAVAAAAGVLAVLRGGSEHGRERTTAFGAAGSVVASASAAAVAVPTSAAAVAVPTSAAAVAVQTSPAVVAALTSPASAGAAGVADAGPAEKLRPVKKKRDPAAEPSIVRDPGF